MLAIIHRSFDRFLLVYIILDFLKSLKGGFSVKSNQGYMGYKKN